MTTHLEYLKVVQNLLAVSEDYYVIDVDMSSQTGEKSVIYVENEETGEEMKVYVTTVEDQHTVTSTHNEMVDYLSNEGVETTLVQTSVLGMLGMKSKTLTVADDVVEVVVTAKHFKSATTGDEAQDNPLAQALKEKFNTTNVTTAHNVVKVDDKAYVVSKFNDDVVRKENDYTINQLIKRARNKQGTGKFVVTLKEIQ